MIDDPAVLAIPEMTLYLGLVEDDPVTTALRFNSHRIAGIFNVSTQPAHRRRGPGEALTWRAALDGATEGCVASYLQASPMGFPLYRRMGYEHMTSYPTWTPVSSPAVGTGG